MDIHAAPVSGHVKKPIPTASERIVIATGHSTNANVIGYAVIVSTTIIPSWRFAPFDAMLQLPAA